MVPNPTRLINFVYLLVLCSRKLLDNDLVNWILFQWTFHCFDCFLTHGITPHQYFIRKTHITLLCAVSTKLVQTDLCSK